MLLAIRFHSLSNSFSTSSYSAQGTLRAFLNTGRALPLMIKWALRPLIPHSKQFTRSGKTVENENPVQHGHSLMQAGHLPSRTFQDC